ncbi:MAG TPA: MCP four helix bundle domain-containing protein, partial [Candidatus Saccharimonadales bacterium]|nr:MCP four helix bundle domain-containing protein [Candidatus Saccharimonadales bacterium]
MSFFKDMTIGRRILFGLSLPLVVLALQGAFSLRALHSVDVSTAGIQNNNLPGAILLGKISTDAADLSSDQLRYIAATDTNQQAALEATMQGSVIAIQQNETTYKTLINQDKERTTYQAFESKWNAFAASHQVFLPLAKAHKTQEAAKVLAQSDNSFDAMAVDLTKLVAINQEDAAAAAAHAGANFAFVQKIVFVGILTALLFSVLAGWYMKMGANQISGVVKNSVEQLIKLSLALSASTQQASAAAQQNAAIAQQVASGATQQSAQA